MAPLPAGEYSVIVADQARGGLQQDKTVHPLPAVFLNRKDHARPERATKSIEVRAVPHVVVEGQFVDSSGKPTTGFAPHIWGSTKDNGDTSWFAETQIDEHGRFFRPRRRKGFKVRLNLHDNEHHSLRARVSKDAPLSDSSDVDLGRLDKDKTDIAVVRYVAPPLLVKAVDRDGKIVKGFRPTNNVSLERQDDGRWRSSQMLPDKEFTITVEAKGFEPKSEKVKLPEGAVKELEMKLKPVAPKASGSSHETSQSKTEGKTMQTEALVYTGRLTDKETGKPIAGAAVTVVQRVRSELPFEKWPNLGETKRQTDAKGEYTFTVLPGQAAEGRLRIDITAKHPNYVDFDDCYSLDVTRRNEKPGERPFFRSIALDPAAKISGTVVTPDGKPAAGVVVRAVSTPSKEDELVRDRSWTTTTTDADGRFQVKAFKQGEAIFWILPKDYSPSTHLATPSGATSAVSCWKKELS